MICSVNLRVHMFMTEVNCFQKLSGYGICFETVQADKSGTSYQVVMSQRFQVILFIADVSPGSVRSEVLTANYEISA